MHSQDACDTAPFGFVRTRRHAVIWHESNQHHCLLEVLFITVRKWSCWPRRGHQCSTNLQGGASCLHQTKALLKFSNVDEVLALSLSHWYARHAELCVTASSFTLTKEYWGPVWVYRAEKPAVLLPWKVYVGQGPRNLCVYWGNGECAEPIKLESRTDIEFHTMLQHAGAATCSTWRMCYHWLPLRVL